MPVLPLVVATLALTLAFSSDGQRYCSADELRVGVATVDITPPVGFRKGGRYGEIISTGVHSPLSTKAIFLQQAQVATLLIINDLLSVPAALTNEARQRISRSTGVPVEHVVILATHNHGSPEYWGSLRDIFHEAAVAEHGMDPHESVDYQSKLGDAWNQVAQAAIDRAVPATVELLVTQQLGMAFNRRFHMRDGSVRFNPGIGNPEILRPAGPIDPELPFLLFRSKTQSTPIGGLSIFAMHTAVFGGTEFGADFPGVLAVRLADRFGPEFISLFGEGTAGDINHVDVHNVSRRSVDRGSVLRSRQIGEELSNTIVQALPQLKALPQPDLAVVQRVVSAPFQAVSRLRYEQARDLLRHQAQLDVPFLDLVACWRDLHRFQHAQDYGSSKPLEVQAIRIDRDTAIVTLPHEVFVEIGIDIKASSPFRHTLVMTLANDVDYYIPTRRAFVEGSYEVTTCPLDPGCGELLSTTAISLLHELAQLE